MKPKESAADFQAVKQCLSRFPKDYIRLVRADSVKKQPRIETTIQRS
ncbi:ribulose bisphosphate carboxylase small subunit [Synechococcus sp. H60.1]